MTRPTPEEAIQRLRAWIVAYGPQKQPDFIADLEAVLADRTAALRDAYNAGLDAAKEVVGGDGMGGYAARIEALKEQPT